VVVVSDVVLLRLLMGLHGVAETRAGRVGHAPAGQDSAILSLKRRRTHYRTLFVESIDIREYKDCSLVRPVCLFWLSSYVTSHHLAVAPLLGAKDQFYCTIYYITLNSNCEAWGVFKNLKLIVEDRARCQN
jgi:hypothetical protein